MLEQIADPIASVLADGAYDSKAVYEAAQGRGGGRAVRVLLPGRILHTMTCVGIPDSYRVA